MLKFFEELPEKGISAVDIRRLLRLDIPIEDIQGVIRSLDYWCKEWRGKRFPTPLRVVYCLDNLKMIALPFWDKTIDQRKLWGIEVNGLAVHKKVFSKVAFGDVRTVLRECSYRTYQASPGEGDIKYGIRVPSAQDIRSIAVFSKQFAETVQLLRDNGVDIDDWNPSAYWVQSTVVPYPMSISIVEADHLLIRQPATEDKICDVYPVLNLFEGDDGLDFIGSLDRHSLPDQVSEKYAKKLSKK